MKFDAYSWKEVQINVEVPHEKGKLLLRLSAVCPLYITAQGYEALAGRSDTYDLEISEDVTFRVDADAGVRAYVYQPEATSVVADGEVYTNIDRQPYESGALAEVTRARRQLEMERRAMLSQVRAENARLLAAVQDVRDAGVAGAGHADALPDPVPPVVDVTADAAVIE